MNFLAFMELRRQLFGRYRRRHSRSRSHSPQHHGHRSYGGCGYGRRDDNRGRGYGKIDDDRERRPRSRSPGRQGRRSPGGRRDRSPVRESSAERREKIERWNREREQAESCNVEISSARNDSYANDRPQNVND